MLNIVVVELIPRAMAIAAKAASPGALTSSLKPWRRSLSRLCRARITVHGANRYYTTQQPRRPFRAIAEARLCNPSTRQHTKATMIERAQHWTAPGRMHYPVVMPLRKTWHGSVDCWAGSLGGAKVVLKIASFSTEGCLYAQITPVSHCGARPAIESSILRVYQFRHPSRPVTTPRKTSL